MYFIALFTYTHIRCQACAVLLKDMVLCLDICLEVDKGVNQITGSNSSWSDNNVNG